MTRAMGKRGGEVGVRPEGLFCLLALTAGASEKNFRGKVAPVPWYSEPLDRVNAGTRDHVPSLIAFLGQAPRARATRTNIS